MRQLAFGIRALACACAVLLAPGVPRRAAAQTDPSAVLGGAPLSCGLSGSTFSCASNLTSSGGSDLPITVQLTNGQNTSNPINYTLQATVSGANPDRISVRLGPVLQRLRPAAERRLSVARLCSGPERDRERRCRDDGEWRDRLSHRVPVQHGRRGGRGLLRLAGLPRYRKEPRSGQFQRVPGRHGHRQPDRQHPGDRQWR